MIFGNIWEALLAYVIVLGVFFVSINFRWIWKEVRNISENKGGFIKLCQLVFIILSWIIFVFILIYYVIHPNQVNALNIILTVIVGFLGTMMGLFFSQDVIKSLEDRVKIEKSKKEIALKKRVNLLRLLKEKIEREK